MKKYNVDLNSFNESFPKDVSVPKLLLSFGAWLKKFPDGTLGDFYALESEVLDGLYLGNDSAEEEFRSKLGLFLNLADSNWLALWNYGEEKPAVVFIGSEGELENIAPSLETFLILLSKGETNCLGLDEDEGVSSRPKLKQWLEENNIKAIDQDVPNFEKWVDAVVKKSNKAQAKPKKLSLKPIPKDLFFRVEGLIGKFADDPEVVKLCNDLGFDIANIKNADELKEMVRTDQGFSLEFFWPWDLPNKRLQKKYPKSKRKQIKSRILWGIYMYPEGYEIWNHKKAGNITFKGFPGELPGAITFQDSSQTAKKKLTKLWDKLEVYDKDIYYHDKSKDFIYILSFAPWKKGKIKKGMMQYIYLGIKQEYD